MAANAPAAYKRFYKTAAVSEAGGAFEVLLDGCTVRTPAGRKLSAPTAALATAIAQEWNEQGDTIAPAALPLTRLANTACDGVADRREEVIEEILRYAASDAVCYRATHPAELVRRQSEAWDPILQGIEREFGALFHKTSGIRHVEQPRQSLEAIREAVSAVNTFQLAALLAMTSLIGSVLITLAFLQGLLSAEEAWAAAHIDEDWQQSQWGTDSEAARRSHARRADFMNAARFFLLAGGSATLG